MPGRVLHAVFVLGFIPSRRLRRLWDGLIDAAEAEAAGHGRTLDVRRHAHGDAVPLDPPPALLVGHSFGGGRCVELCHDLDAQGHAVGHLLLLDPVPRRGWGAFDRTSFVLPDNVESAACFLRRRCWGLPPFSHPIRSASCPHTNRRVGLDHDGVAGRPEVRRHLCRVVRDLCGGSGGG